MAQDKPAKPPRPPKAPTAKPPKPAKAVAKAAAKDKDDQPSVAASWWQASVQFLLEVKQELKKVTWPPKKQTLSATGVVLSLVILVSLFLGLVDFVLVRLVRLVLG
jgi:preprotein translocase subunit SecE